MEALHAQFELAVGALALDVAFTVPERGITGLFGPSGAGKTTILRCLAGLTRARGACRAGKETWQDDARGIFVPTHRRALGYVAQDAGLFPHLTVRKNIGYGFKRAPAQGRSVSMDQAVEWLGIQAFLDRMPATLSGGERQRVAIARALLAGPQLLLLDEPVSALDEASRAEILPCLARLHRELTVPVVLVTHALGELARFADTIVHLDHGRVIAAGTLVEMLPRLGAPADALAALEGAVTRVDEAQHLMCVDTVFGGMWCARAAGLGDKVRLQIAAREVSLGLEQDPRSSLLNQLPARVESICGAGPGQAILTLRAMPDGAREVLLALVTQRSIEHLGIAPGQLLIARVKGVNVCAC